MKSVSLLELFEGDYKLVMTVRVHQLGVLSLLIPDQK